MTSTDLVLPLPVAPTSRRRFGERTRARAAVAAAAVLFGTSATATRLVAGGPDPWTAASWRLVIGGAVLVALSVAAGDAPWRRSVRWGAAGPGALAVVGMQVGYFGAVTRMGVAAATIVTIGCGPAAAGVIGWLQSGERVTGRWTAGVVMAIAGMVAVSGADGVQLDPIAWAMAIGAGTCFPLYGAAIRDLSADRPVLTSIATIFGAAVVPAAAVALVAGSSPVAGVGTATVLLYLGVITPALAYLLWSHGLATLSLGDTVTITLIEPIAAAFLAVLALGEHLGTAGMVGVVAVLAGIGVATSRSSGQRRPLRTGSRSSSTLEPANRERSGDAGSPSADG